MRLHGKAGPDAEEAAESAGGSPMHDGLTEVGEHGEVDEEQEGTAFLSTLRDEFVQQAGRMPRYLRKILVGNAPAALASPAALLRALHLTDAQWHAAQAALRRPTHALVARVPHFLDGRACARLRAMVDASPSRKGDSVDGLPEFQRDLTQDELVELVGVERLRELPGAFYSRLHGVAEGSVPRLVCTHAFVRRYDAAERPWFAFHCDRAALTANVALADDARHVGGRLLALADNALLEIERAEGEATVHPSELLHGVASMRSGVRYSLIVFWTREDHDETRERSSDDAVTMFARRRT